MDGDGGSIENLVRRIIRSVQEPSADRQQNRRVRWPTTVTAKANSLTAKANKLNAIFSPSRVHQFSLVFVYFYCLFYSLPKDFWFRHVVVNVQYNIDRDRKKSVSTIFICNLEIFWNREYWKDPERLPNHPETEKRRQRIGNVWFNSFIFFNSENGYLWLYDGHLKQARLSPNQLNDRWSLNLRPIAEKSSWQNYPYLKQSFSWPHLRNDSS